MGEECSTREGKFHQAGPANTKSSQGFEGGTEKGPCGQTRPKREGWSALNAQLRERDMDTQLPSSQNARPSMAAVTCAEPLGSHEFVEVARSGSCTSDSNSDILTALRISFFPSFFFFFFFFFCSYDFYPHSFPSLPAQHPLGPAPWHRPCPGAPIRETHGNIWSPPTASSPKAERPRAKGVGVQ